MQKYKQLNMWCHATLIKTTVHVKNTTKELVAIEARKMGNDQQMAKWEWEDTSTKPQKISCEEVFLKNSFEKPIKLDFWKCTDFSSNKKLWQLQSYNWGSTTQSLKYDNTICRKMFENTYKLTWISNSSPTIKNVTLTTNFMYNVHPPASASVICSLMFHIIMQRSFA